MQNLKNFLFRRIAVLLVLAMIAAMLPVAAPVSATEAGEYPVLELDTQTTVTITGGSLTYLAFTPEYSCSYQFYSVYGTSTCSSSDTYAYLYDSEFNQLTYNDDGNGSYQFRITYTLEAGQTYYLGVRYYGGYSGSFDVMAKANHTITETILQEATCTASGVRQRTCSNCSYDVTEDYILEHNYADGYCTLCGALFTVSGTCGDSAEWTLTGDGILSISGTGSITCNWDDYVDMVETVVVEDGITVLGDNVFADHDNMTSVQLPDSVHEIGYCSFWSSSMLTELALPEQLESIDRLALSETGLISLEFPETLTSLGERALEACYDLDSLTFMGNAPTIGENAFLYDSLVAQYPAANETWTESVMQTYGAEHIQWVPVELDSIVASGTCGDDVIWMLDTEGTLTISGTGDMDDYNYADGAPWSEYREQINCVVISSGVTSIGNYAFEDCVNMTQCDIPESVVSIGYVAFSDCDSLLAITIPSGVTHIRTSTFAGCDSLVDVTLSESISIIDYEAFYGCTSLTSIEIPASVSQIGALAFGLCFGLTEIVVDPENAYYSSADGALMDKAQTQLIQYPVARTGAYTLPETTTSIYDYAFANAAELTAVTVPDTLTSIGNYAFQNCTSLEAFAFPTSLTELGESAFAECSALKEAVIHEGLSIIEDSAFYNCTSLTRAEIPEGVSYISFVAFHGCTSLTAVDLPESLLSIGGDAFANCESLTSLNIPDSVYSIGFGAFYNCLALTEIHLPAALNVLERSSFAGCKSLTEVDIPDNVGNIAESVFVNCTSLESVQMPEMLTDLNWYAFANCTALTELTLPASLLRLTDAVYETQLSCTNLKSLTFQGNAPAIEPETFTGAAFTGYYPAGNSTWNSQTKASYGGNVTWVPYGEDLVATGTCGDSVTWTLRADNVLTISGAGSVALRWDRYADMVTSVVVEEGITALANNVFTVSPALESVRFLGNAPEFADNIFAGLTLTAYYPADNATWTEEVRQSYGGTVIWATGEEGEVLSSGQCGDNVYWQLNGNGQLSITGQGAMWDYSEELPDWTDYTAFITEVVVSDGVTTIGDYALSDCAEITSLQLPDSVYEIGYCSFWNCGKLAQVELPAQLESIDARAFLNSGLTSLELPETLTSLGNKALGSCTDLDTVRFYGDAPAIGSDAFYDDHLTAWYPMDNETWTEDVLLDYGGTITWKAVGPNGELGMGKCGDDLTWSVSAEGVLHISGTGAMYDYSYIYSEEEDAVFAPWLSIREQITQIVMDEGITAIGDFAFQGVYNAPNTVIPSTVEVIGGRAFNSHTFDHLVIPEGVRVIEEYAFVYGEINTLSFPSTLESVGKGVFEWTSINEVHIPSMEDWMEIQFDSFFSTPFADYGSTDLYVDGVLTTQIVIPESVTEIGASQFEFFSNLSGIQFHNGVTRIGDYAFAMSPNTGGNAPDFTEVTIPESVGYIGSYAFRRCSALADVYILNPECVFGEYAFDECNSVVNEYDELSSSGTTIHGYAGSTAEAYAAAYGYNFEPLPAREIASGWSGYTTWSLTEDGVITFSGEGAMKNYTTKDGMPWHGYADQITAVVIEEGVTSIGSYAFYGMNIESIEIASTVTSIGDYAFKNASKLGNVVLPENLTSLGESAFYACTSLTAIEIPASLWTIKPYAFKNCTALAQVTFHEGNLQKISDGAFYGTALTALVLPDCLDILDVYSFKNCAQLASITIGTGITEIREAAFYGTAVADVVIPEGVTKVGPYAFKNCTALEAVALPESLTSIGEAAFYACTGLKAMEIPDAVTTIGSYAFRKCTGLVTVTFGAELTTIGEASFYGCTGLTELVIPDKVITIKPYAFKTCTGLTSVTFGANVATLGEGAFHTCTGLKNIVFPASLTSIGDYCFSGSYNLWKLTFEGDAPSIGSGAFKGMDAYAYYPGDNATWTSSKMLNYGGTITWKAN